MSISVQVMVRHPSLAISMTSGNMMYHKMSGNKLMIFRVSNDRQHFHLGSEIIPTLGWDRLRELHQFIRMFIAIVRKQESGSKLLIFPRSIFCWGFRSQVIPKVI